jgi:hypothetical protein
MIEFIGTSITITYNSSQSVTAWGSLNSFLDYDRLLFHYDWLARITCVLRLTSCWRLQNDCISDDWITFPFITRWGSQTEDSLERFDCCNMRIHLHGNAWTLNRCPATVYSALSLECVFTETTVREQTVAPQWTSTPISPFRLSGILTHSSRKRA